MRITYSSLLGLQIQATKEEFTEADRKELLFDLIRGLQADTLEIIHHEIGQIIARKRARKQQ